ncbi:MAG: RNA methyltransferase [Bacteroidales bacterium]|jgi:TrmH family RNA methyltransferase|nr:RNA methyltransferase [Bacteroidales bacterium]
MLSTNEFKQLRMLQQKKYRKEYRKFLVEGTKSVMEVIHSDYVAEKIYATQHWQDKHSECSFDVQTVSPKECERISSLTTSPEIFALVQMKPDAVFDANACKKLLLLDGIKNAGNLGTIIRTADWFGIQGIVCSEDTVELYNPKTIQASMGSFAHIPVFYRNLEFFLTENKDKYLFFGTFMEGKSIRNAVFPEYSAIVLGSESEGISEILTGMIDEKISIPRGYSDSESKAESLNVSLAAAIVCYELMK